MLSCKEVSELVSQGLDRSLSFAERMRLRIHLLMCRSCARYEQQLRFLRHAASRLSQGTSGAGQQASDLPPEAREHIQEALKKHLD